jgi:MFS family permease
MAHTIWVLGIVVVLAVAARSTWSPCGVSMLSTLTPMSERARGHRWWLTAAWYIVGGVVGGTAVGLLVAPLAALVGAVQPAPSLVAAVVAAAALLAMATDLRLGRWRLPGHTRQVDEVWITKYRRWVYTAGFGAQIGFGFATVFMTGALYLMVVLMAATGDPLTAVWLAAFFGGVRGAAIVAGCRIDNPATLRSFHRRFEDLAGWSIALVVAVEAAVVVAVVATVGSAVWGLVVAGVPLAVFAVQHRRRRAADEPTPLVLPIAVARVPAGI